MKKFFLPIVFAITLTNCSVYKVLSQPGAADLSGINTGTNREVIISKLGAPKVTETSKDGRKQDIFEFESGYHQASKIRALPYLAADLVTLTLAEILLWPLEMTVMDRATCTGIATYDDSLKVSSWSVSRKQNSSAQDC